MKLHRLELTGFGPFRGTQSVDFDAFDADGLFLISGRTGAGKSSILDGVSFALYGTVPRYDGGDRRLRSDHCGDGDPTWVRLEFTVGDRRLRVTRAPEYDRPAKRGTGTVTEPTAAELEELIGEVWTGIAAKPREVGIELSEVLGLTAVQFQQVILLAQNKFSRFLLAGNDERQALLRTLFDTRRFAQYEDALDQRRRDAQKDLDAAGTRAALLLDQVETLIADAGLGHPDDAPVPGELAARRAAADAALARAAYRVDTTVDAVVRAEEAAVAATVAHQQLVGWAKAAAELDAVRVQFAQHEAEAPQIAADRDRAARAVAAETLRAPLAALAREQGALAAAEAVADSAATAWHALADDEGADAPEAAVERLTGALAVAAAAADAEKTLVAAAAAVVAHTAAVEAADAELAALETAAAGIPAERADRDVELAAARSAAGDRDVLAERRAAAAAALAAAEERDDLQPRLVAAERAYLAAAERAADAAREVTALLQRRLDGMAGELAADLIDGAPCAVCGSTAHPAPAPRVVAPVTDDDVSAAERARDAAVTAERAAADAARTVREQHTAAAARAGGDDATALRTRVDELTAALTAAEHAQQTLETATRALAALDDRAAATAAARDEVGARRTGILADLAAAQARVEAAQTEVDDARGAFDTVAERVTALTRRLEAARAAHRSAQQLAERRRAREVAADDLAAHVAGSEFADAAAAEAALLDTAVRRDLEARVAAHAAALHAARERLLELELELSGREVSSAALAAAADAAATADAERTAAITARSGAEHTRDRLAAQLAQVAVAYDAVGDRAAETAALTRFADTIAGRAPNTRKMDLETFVLAAELEEIVAAANLRLTEMSAGRYTLHHSDAKASHGRASGLGIEVLDAHTGRRRPPQSLSGGETFLASLALALGLAEVVTHRAGGLRLDTLFVDEGFGSLDPETLELAMRTLDELRAGGRTVGLISHVEAMKEQLPAQLVVEADAHGPSRIRQEVRVG
ncbi:AAA family ATPase [Microbacterium sp. W1N]|uniref:AAA family ATPase n=1 Tax=Microbacterium festucae TaxID=2977531 RepID=UPI0021C0AC23|nr:AAA family ATPase [Microbacterium festucae]MCT9820712.1 AAA family ATPase [Microbacterium festucae]